jgi:hypothetical protein
MASNRVGYGCTMSASKPPLKKYNKTRTPWPESASELYGPRDRRLSAKLVPTFADRGCHVVSVPSLRPYSLYQNDESLWQCINTTIDFLDISQCLLLSEWMFQRLGSARSQVTKLHNLTESTKSVSAVSVHTSLLTGTNWAGSLPQDEDRRQPLKQRLE